MRFLPAVSLTAAVAALGVAGFIALTSARDRWPLTTAAAPPQTNTGIVFRVRPPNSIVALTTTLTVPDPPPPSGTLFLWPGLQPVRGGAKYQPIDNGVLQPVLTWGPSCANPDDRPAPYSTWWVSAQYVNTFGNFPNYTGCHGGPIMPVRAGDSLAMRMTLSRSVWTQTVTDRRTGRSVSFRIDMLGQAQHRAFFVIEGDGQNPVSPVVFTATTLTFSSPQRDACRAQKTGSGDPRDTVSPPAIAGNGTSCRIASIVLHAPAGPISRAR